MTLHTKVCCLSPASAGLSLRPGMSVMGQKRTKSPIRIMSAFGGKADIIAGKADIEAFDFRIFGEPPKCTAARWAKNFRRTSSSCLKNYQPKKFRRSAFVSTVADRDPSAAPRPQGVCLIAQAGREWAAWQDGERQAHVSVVGNSPAGASASTKQYRARRTGPQRSDRNPVPGRRL